MPVLKNLESINLNGCPSDQNVLNWIGMHRKIYSLSLSIKTNLNLTWEWLAKLPDLLYMDITSSQCSDEDFALILKHSTAKVYYAYYTEITQKSWHNVFASPHLKCIYVSTSMLEGGIPEGLPKKTSLNEVVTNNVGGRHQQFLKALLKKYPGVKQFHM